MSDELDGIFDNLSISDFMRSARGDLTLRHPSPEDFNQFLRRHANMLQAIFTASRGELQAFAILATISNEPTLERLYLPVEEECVGDYVARLAKEARETDVNALFFTMRTMVKESYATAEEVAAADARVSEMSGHTEESMFWFCQYGNERRVGAMMIDESGESLTRSIETTQRASLLETILNPMG